MVRAHASGTVDIGLTRGRIKINPMTLKLVFTASLLDAQHYKDNVENQPAQVYLCSWERHLTGFIHLGAIQMAGNF